MTLPLFPSQSGANFSPDGLCRFSLWRFWSDGPVVAFIGLNPSTANYLDDDPTIKRVQRIARHNGFGGVYMLNCFPHISTDPDGLDISLCRAQNEQEWVKVRALVSCVVFAWGAFKIVKTSGVVNDLIRVFGSDCMALHINDDKSPKHPLFCRAGHHFHPLPPWIRYHLPSSGPESLTCAGPVGSAILPVRS